ncbi:hypothetical protein L8V85_07875 [Campylobacter sp. IFREMER_LSEM_CL2090]|uniref:hypothetical protein n=1 Tax=Campylobacter sp. IFREMER_LSEM_CL2090 TaxID=2911617 RepID=UPI0021E78520|nr:hypothetical protein [Campylobacter sp. IFREMER_LSEM_CL2090]MCV3403853.1 hypothetical protein [Campylobacter sp. IFREMER_LSEM_CL2090]
MSVSLFNDEVKSYTKNYHFVTNFLLYRYGLSFDRSGNEKYNTSLKIKPNTSLITDFNGSFSGDVIDFIVFKENVSTKEALGVFVDFHKLPTQKVDSFKPIKEVAKDDSYLKNMAYSLQADYNLYYDDILRNELLDKTFFDNFRLFMDLCKILDFVKINEFENIINEYFGFSKNDKSLALILRDKGEIKSIAIKEKIVKDKTIKWFKLKGSNAKFIKFVKAKENGLLKDCCFIFSGIKEIIISELLGINAICFQSDSTMKYIQTHEQINELLSFIDEKFLYFIIENDESSFNANLGLLKELAKLKPSVLNSFSVLNYDEYKNADFVDFIVYLMKELKKDYEKDRKGVNTFLAFAQKYFKSYFMKGLSFLERNKNG